VSNTKDVALTEWRQLRGIALSETAPAKLLERIAHARCIILFRIEKDDSKPQRNEQIAAPLATSYHVQSRPFYGAFIERHASRK
jgi:hypothetical protein